MSFENFPPHSPISYFDALQLHFKLGSDPSLLFHCNHVVNVASQIIQQLPPSTSINRDLVLIGALLHDIGRNKTQGIGHAVAGSEIILDTYPKHNFIDHLAKVVSTHIGGGIPKEEAKSLGLPAKDFIPLTLEEKIVCYADKMVDYDFDKTSGRYEIKKWYTYNSVANEIDKLASKLGSDHPAVARLKNLEKELLKVNNGQEFRFTGYMF